jgi:lipopolysaccharide export system protein LptA
MSRPFFIVNIFLIFSVICAAAYAADLPGKSEKKPIVITSETLTADNKNHRAVFEGSVVAKTNELTILSDRMTVFYTDSGDRVSKIHAVGNVKVYNSEKVIFAKEALYFDKEEKIIFSGNAKALEGKNLITGKQITFYLKTNRAVIEDSKIILQNEQELK